MLTTTDRLRRLPPLTALTPLIALTLLVPPTVCTAQATRPARAVAEARMTRAALRQEGAFGFPQSRAQVLCDTPDLRVSVWSNREYLYVQAIVWHDSEDGVVSRPDGRKTADKASVCLHVTDEPTRSANVDRDYSLNPWPEVPGLAYSIHLSPRSTTGLKPDSAGRGAIRYCPTEGAKVRVDSLLLPLAEVGRKPGDTLHLAYWGSSPKQNLTFNSVGAERGDYPSALPLDSYHAVELTIDNSPFSPARVPEGRSQAVAAVPKPSGAAGPAGRPQPAAAAAPKPPGTKAPQGPPQRPAAAPKSSRAVAELAPGRPRPAGRMPAEAALQTRFRTIKIDGAPLTEVIDFYRDQLGVNILVSWRAIESAGIKRDTPITLQASGATFASILQRTLAQASKGHRDPLAYDTTQGMIDINVASQRPRVIQQEQW